MTVQSEDIRDIYVAINNGIFGDGVLGDNHRGNINQDVMNLADDLLLQLERSNVKMDEFLALLTTSVIMGGITGFQIYRYLAKGFYRPTIGPGDAESIAGGVKELFTWIRGNRSYAIILNNMARTYKSYMAMALAGIY